MNAFVVFVLVLFCTQFALVFNTNEKDPKEVFKVMVEQFQSNPVKHFDLSNGEQQNHGLLISNNISTVEINYIVTLKEITWKIESYKSVNALYSKNEFVKRHMQNSALIVLGNVEKCLEQKNISELPFKAETTSDVYEAEEPRLTNLFERAKHVEKKKVSITSTITCPNDDQTKELRKHYNNAMERVYVSQLLEADSQPEKQKHLDKLNQLDDAFMKAKTKQQKKKIFDKNYLIHSVVSHDKTTGTIKIIVQAATNTEEFYAPIDVADTMVQVIKKFCNSAKNSYENQLLESVKCEVGLMNEEAPFNYFIFRLHATITEQTLPDLSALKIK